MDEHLQTPSGAEAPATTIPSTATMAQATAQAATHPGGKKVTPSKLVEQVGALQQAETIKQLQNQVKLLESQSRDTGKIFLATTTSLITSAFALVAALAWNDAIQNLFKDIFPPSDVASQVTTPQVISAFGYAVLVTIIVVLVIFYLTKLNTRVGGRSLIGGGGGEMKKE